jgi:hypothetical protein
MLQTGGTGIERLTVICPSVQDKMKWLTQLKQHVKVMPAVISVPAAVKPQILQVHLMSFASLGSSTACFITANNLMHLISFHVTVVSIYACQVPKLFV